MTAPWYQWDGEDLLLSVYVQPKASRNLIDGVHGDRLKVRITAPPVDGRANAHLLDFLAGAFGVPRRRVTLLAGDTGRAKRIRIERPAQLPEGVDIAPHRPGN